MSKMHVAESGTQNVTMCGRVEATKVAGVPWLVPFAAVKAQPYAAAYQAPTGGGCIRDTHMCAKCLAAARKQLEPGSSQTPRPRNKVR